MNPEYLGNELMKKYAPKPEVIDACNKYPDCHTCITADEQGIKCGWCMGAFLDYKEQGLTKYKCGGFKDDEPRSFTCGKDFKTEDCSGYKCDWSTSKCSYSEQGSFPDEATCNATC